MSEQHFRIDDVQQLDQRTRLAEIDVERIRRLAREFAGVREKRIGERLLAKREKRGELRAFASSTAGSFVMDVAHQIFALAAVARAAEARSTIRSLFQRPPTRYWIR